MQEVKALVNTAFEAVGSPIRAHLDGEDLVVRDLIAVPDGLGNASAYDLSEAGAPVFTLPVGESLAAAMALHVLKKIIANALG